MDCIQIIHFYQQITSAIKQKIQATVTYNLNARQSNFVSQKVGDNSEKYNWSSFNWEMSKINSKDYLNSTSALELYKEILFSMILLWFPVNISKSAFGFRNTEICSSFESLALEAFQWILVTGSCYHCYNEAVTNIVINISLSLCPSPLDQTRFPLKPSSVPIPLSLLSLPIRLGLLPSEGGREFILPWCSAAQEVHVLAAQLSFELWVLRTEIDEPQSNKKWFLCRSAPALTQGKDWQLLSCWGPCMLTVCICV